MQFRVFYLFERAGEALSSASAVAMQLRDIREQLLPRLRTADDYLGLIDARDNVLQILCEPESKRFWVELPIDAARASYGRHLDFAGLDGLLRTLPEILDQAHFPDFEYRPW